ncbi:MAG: type II toxin-antitoxin system RelE/ParE family toxin [Deferribacteraceae bacterium]|jgi:plasmid stabilization system protein ParE|nr:type II toxin-antitoxin system RelE/ParE family toxin [Deferribacteraceae bacterium]
MDSRRYNIEISKLAQSDYDNIYTYLAYELCAESSAKNIAALLEEKIDNLSYFPLSFPLCNESLLRAEGIHKMVFKKYLIFYTVDEVAQKVSVLRILHSLRDYENLL